jgi:hypothetical protein
MQPVVGAVARRSLRRTFGISRSAQASTLLKELAVTLRLPLCKVISVTWSNTRLARAAFFLGGVTAFVALGLGGSAQPAHAAPCPVPTYGIVNGNLSIQGTPPCSEDPEVISPFCSGGTVWFEYGVNGALLGPLNTGVGCGTPTQLSIFGNAGDDVLDLSRVSVPGGFTGISRSNLIDGGYGGDRLVAGPTPNVMKGGPDDDIVLARNGISDSVDCGEGIDAVQSDQASVDALSGCEITDFVATPASPTPIAPTPIAKTTGRRAAALQKCRKLKRRKARRECIRHAKKLPV